MNTKLSFSSIKNDIPEDPILSGSKVSTDDGKILSKDVLKTPLDGTGDFISSAEIEFTFENRHLFAHVVSYGMGNRYSLSEESIMKNLRSGSFQGKSAEETLKAYMKAVCSVQCLQAFGGNMIPLSRFYYYYCELENMLGQSHTNTGL